MKRRMSKAEQEASRLSEQNGCLQEEKLILQRVMQCQKESLDKEKVTIPKNTSSRLIHVQDVDGASKARLEEVSSRMQRLEATLALTTDERASLESRVASLSNELENVRGECIDARRRAKNMEEARDLLKQQKDAAMGAMQQEVLKLRHALQQSMGEDVRGFSCSLSAPS
jgi:septal ring factor EnvC (AmiA/AmiB activator)